MKTSSLILAFCLAVGMAVQSDAKKDETIQAKDSGNQDQLTTFTEYDEMTFEELIGDGENSYIKLSEIE